MWLSPKISCKYPFTLAFEISHVVHERGPGIGHCLQCGLFVGEGRFLLSLMPLESDEIVQVENSHTCYETSILWNKLSYFT